MANPDNTSTTPLATVSTASGPERADQSFLEWANSLGDPLRAGAIDSASIRRATALLMALADRDAAAAIEVLDEFIANVGIDQVEFEAAVRSYEQDYALDGSQRLILFAGDGTPVSHVLQQDTLAQHQVVAGADAG